MRTMASKASQKLNRHKAACKVCNSSFRTAIEDQWCLWTPSSVLAAEYRISSSSIARHMAAFNLRRVRAANLRRALERIIEDADPAGRRELLKKIREWNLKHRVKSGAPGKRSPRKPHARGIS